MKTIPYNDILQQTHTLIAGSTGSGKSVLINGLLTELINKPCKLVLIDLKKVELIAYKNSNKTIAYCDNVDSAISALSNTVKRIEMRYKTMQFCKRKQSSCDHVYVIIDELADLMTVAKKDILPLLQRIGQIGRAANVHIIAATQCPLVSIIPTSLKVNFTCIIGLKVRSKQDSRNILGVACCETLPQYGYGYVLFAGKDIELYSIPFISENVISAAVKPFQKSFIDCYPVIVTIVCILVKILILH